MNCRTEFGLAERRRWGSAAAVSLLAFAVFAPAQSSRPSDSSQKRSNQTEQVAAVQPTDAVRPTEAFLPADTRVTSVNPATVATSKWADEDARLLELATELKSAVDQSNLNTLSIEVIRKAQSIQTLAKGFKKKIKLAEGAR